MQNMSSGSSLAKTPFACTAYDAKGWTLTDARNRTPTVAIHAIWFAIRASTSAFTPAQKASSSTALVIAMKFPYFRVVESGLGCCAQ